jgi:triosephosphate isomerase
MDNAAVRPVIVAANWKMHTTPADAGPLAVAVASAAPAADVVRVICPPYVCLATVRDALAGSGAHVGAQEVHAENAGAFTGDVSAQMLRGLATWTIVGHSERRRDHRETDELVGRKLRRCLEHRLRPILCVGEQLAERDAGRAADVVERQLRGSFAELEDTGRGLIDGPGAQDSATWLVVAYEPVWAIGTGRTARGADAAAMADTVRSVLADLGWGAAATRLPVLYGGSVTSATIGEFLAEPAIDGALVGGASLKPDEMAGILARAQTTAAARAAAAPSAA